MQKENQKHEVVEMSSFVQRFSFDDLKSHNVEKLKLHLLDSIGCAIAALNSDPVVMFRQTIEELGGFPHCSLIGTSSKTPVDRAAHYLTSLIRYVDYMDNYLAKHGTCHPSDNIGSLLAVCDHKDLDGRKFLEAMAISYNVQCRMIESEPSMDKGFDHTTQLAYSIAAGVSKLLNFTETQTANAIAMSGSTFNPLVVTRAPHTSQWKGMLSSHIAFGSVNCCLLAEKGMTGPLDVFEGKGGYNDDFGIKKSLDWKSDCLDIYDRLILKKYNAEVHTQSAIEATMHLKKENNISGTDVDSVNVEIFKVAYDITGGSAYGPRDEVRVKEDADHSLPYVLSVALLDGEVMPEQYTKERICREDVQTLLKKVKVDIKLHLPGPKSVIGHLDPYSRAYPDKVMCSVKIKLKNGKQFETEISDFPGFHTNPLHWDDIESKYRRLTRQIPEEKHEKVIAMIKNFESVKVRDFMNILAGF